MQNKLIAIFICSFFIYCSPKCQANTCVVSFLKSDEVGLNQALESKNILANEKIKFFSGPIALRNCLEGDFEKVVLIAHSALIKTHKDETSEAKSSLAYFNHDILHFFPDSVFKNLMLNPKLKKFGIVTCHAEKLASNYKFLFETFKAKKIALAFSTADVKIEDNGVTYLYRSFDQAAKFVYDIVNE